MKLKTSKLAGAALDWAVAMCEGEEIEIVPRNEIINISGEPLLTALAYGKDASAPFAYTTCWAQSGPIIERERIELTNWGMDGWNAKATDYSSRPNADEVFAECFGETPLVAAMRCYAASKLGDEIEIPEGLVSAPVPGPA